MLKSKKIVLISDLEGTLITEDSRIEEEGFMQFLEEIGKLGDLLDSDVEIHIASPMGPQFMDNVIKRMSSLIKKYESEKVRDTSVDIVAGVADFSDSIDSMDMFKRIDKRIIPGDLGGHAMPIRGSSLKKNYVSDLLSLCKEKNELPGVTLFLYSGNGENDVSAMEIIRGLKNGVTIAPNNSPQSVKKNANEVSPKEGVYGIADAISKISEKIRSRKNREKTEDNTGNVPEFE